MKIHQSRLVNQFVRLVKISSPSFKETEIVDYIQDLLSELGLQVHRDQTEKKFGGSVGNLIAKLDGLETRPTILFNAHLDTVKATTDINPIVTDSLIKTDERTILGADNKVAVAAIVETLRMIKEEDIPHGPIEVLFTVAEEAGLYGAKHFDYQQLDAQLGFIFDSANPVGTVITQSPTEINFRIEIFGKAAHAGLNPEEGISAIKVAGELLHQLKIGRINQDTTFNIGAIEGGKETNIITDYVSLKGEVRSLDQTKLDLEVSNLKKICKALAQAWEIEIELDIEQSYPGFNLSASEQVVRLAVAAIKDLGLKPAIKSTGGGSDANILNNQQLPTVNLGNGVEGNHSLEERVRVKDILKLAELVISIIEQAYHHI
ncbi:M20/M25/M40 family metallo-hydrolase [Halanaerocella petrolearia]